MRGLVYAIKDNREPPNPAQSQSHPRHPEPKVMVDRDNAVDYVATIAMARRDKIASFLGLDPERTLLVPVPSSEVTRESLRTARFPTYKLALALASAGLGTCEVLVVNEKPTRTASDGNRPSPEELINNYTLLYRPRPSFHHLYIDDLATSGSHLVALDTVLDRPPTVATFAVAITDSEQVASAYEPRAFSIQYDPDEAPLRPRIRTP